jgi:cyclophilin family peptidyl-prolyl cis-trans isomerase
MNAASAYRAAARAHLERAPAPAPRPAARRLAAAAAAAGAEPASRHAALAAAASAAAGPALRDATLAATAGDRSELASRRAALAAAAAAALALARPARAAPAAAPTAAPPAEPALDTVTDRAFFEFGLCPEAVRADRRLGDKSALCAEPAPLGRLTLELYGRAAPGTVARFKAAVAAGVYDGTSLSKILPGQYLMGGRAGPRRMGLVESPPGMPPNPDLTSAAAFRLTHRPGALSLNLSRNEDGDGARRGDYANLSFLIATGPGPELELDEESNIVFGRVAEGMDVVAAIERVPVFGAVGPGATYNRIASLIGDERADKSRAKWGQPLKAVVITRAGLL